MDATVKKYIPASKLDAVEDFGRDDDGYWIQLREGWEARRTGPGCRTIRVRTTGDLKNQIAGIQKAEAHPKKTSDAQRKAIAEWVKGRDTIVLRLTKEDGAAIREAAKESGITVTQFILDCVHGKRNIQGVLDEE